MVALYHIDTGAHRHTISVRDIDRRGKPDGDPLLGTAVVHLWKITPHGKGVSPSADPECGCAFHIWATNDREKVTCHKCIEKMNRRI